MRNLIQTIEQFRESQSLVYKEQPKRIARDAQAARKTISDHTGRWLFEVIQNAEDAQANKLKICLTSEAVYIADNSKIGFSPEAVESISGTDYSDKAAGTIGRKGVGFKAVYEISAKPQIFAGKNDGVEFSQEKAEKWFDENGLFYKTRIPYEWIPFFISRQKAEEQDPTLEALHNYATVIKLPFRSERAKSSAIKHLESWPPYALLPFKYLQTLQVSSEDFEFKVEIPTGRKGDIWILEDSRNGDAKWKVYHQFFEPPQSLLQQLDPSDAERVKNVGFLVATPIDSGGIPVTIQDSPKIHVFYPTNELSPVGMVLHGEFLVKSDRTALLPIEDTPFNSWVAAKLSECVIDFVQRSYDAEQPSLFMRLLCPLSEDALDSNTTADVIWYNIVAAAKNHLRLPDHNGNEKHNIQCAYLFEDSVVNHSAARSILSGTGKGSLLLHKSFDNDEYARTALKRLGCTVLDNYGILEIISKNAKSKTSDRKWLWSCWQWLAEWLYEIPSYRDEHKFILDQIKKLPIIPCPNQTLSAINLENRVVTWQSDDLTENIPQWMPFNFVSDWLRDKLLEENEKSSTRKMAKELGISSPGQRVVMDAFEKAIDLFWKDQSVNPENLLRFVFESDWPEKHKYNPQPRIQRCPVPIYISDNTQRWEQACNAYFGKEWGEDLLPQLYETIDRVPWVQSLSSPTQKERKALEWLGVASYPRIIYVEDENENNRVRKLLPRDHYLGYGEKRKAWKLDRLDIDSLTEAQAVALLALFAKYWDKYFRKYRRMEVDCQGPRGGPRFSQQIDALWWEETCNLLNPPIIEDILVKNRFGLKKCWLPEKRVQRVLRGLLVVVDTAKFAEHKECVVQWLRDTVRLRHALDEIAVSEWRELLGQMSDIVPEKIDQAWRDRIMRWYAACLESLDEQDFSGSIDVPLLARKGSQWNFCDTGDLWLADDQTLADAFQNDIWQIEFSQSVRPLAKKYFGLRMLSEEVEKSNLPGEEIFGDSIKLNEMLKPVLPYIFVLRCSQATKIDHDDLREKLNSITIIVVDRLTIELILEDTTRRKINSDFAVEHEILYIVNSQSVERIIAGALSEALSIRTDAELYENLLRCNNNSERTEKLFSKGITKNDFERLVRTYRQEPEPTIERARADKTEAERENREHADSDKMVKPVPIAPKEKSGSSGQSGKTDTPKPNNDDFQVHRPSLNLKDTSTCPIEFAKREYEPTGSKFFKEGPVSHKETALSQEDKDIIEDSGREAAARKLKEMGFEVELMPRANPGFDIKGTKAGYELHVEVKAHRKKASVVDLTKREYDDWRDSLRNPSLSWELWNVENLSKNSDETVQITRFSEISEQAMRTRQWMVDLRHCTQTTDYYKAFE